jgi:hypothetical protein
MYTHRVAGEVCRKVSSHVHRSQMVVPRLSDSPVEAGRSRYGCALWQEGEGHIEVEGSRWGKSFRGYCVSSCQQVGELGRERELDCPIHVDMHREHHISLESACSGRGGCKAEHHKKTLSGLVGKEGHQDLSLEQVRERALYGHDHAWSVVMAGDVAAEEEPNESAPRQRALGEEGPLQMDQ